MAERRSAALRPDDPAGGGADRRHLVVANYAAICVTSLLLGDNGSLGKVSDVLRLQDQPAPHCEEQAGSHPHHLAAWPESKAQRITPLLPDEFVGKNRAAGITAHPSGSAVYALNRGMDAATSLSCDPATREIINRRWVPITVASPAS